MIISYSRFIFLFLIIVLNKSIAVNAQVQWVHHIGSKFYDTVEDFELDQDGNFVVTGSFSETVTIGNIVLNSRDETDIFIYKTRPDGSVLWAKTFGGASYGGDVGLGIDSLGNIYVAGGFIKDLFFDNILQMTSVNTWNSFLAKLDKFGNLIWIRGMLAVTTLSEVRVWGRISVKNEAIVVAGNFNGTLSIGGQSISKDPGFSGNDIFIAKFDLEGNMIWLKNPIASSHAYCFEIQIADTGYIYFTGYFTGEIHFGLSTLTAGNATHTDIFLAKMDEAGNFLWARGGIKKSDLQNNNESRSLAIDSLGNCYIVGILKGDVEFGHFLIEGNTNPEYYIVDSFIAKYDSSGQIQYAKIVGKDYAPRLNKMKIVGGKIYLLGLLRSTNQIYYSMFNESEQEDTPISLQAYGFPWDFMIESENVVYVGGQMGIVNGIQSLGEVDGFLMKQIAGCQFSTPSITEIDGPDQICIGSKVSYTVVASSPSNQYTWLIPNDFIPNGIIKTSDPYIELTIQSIGLGSISVFASNVCGASSSTKSVNYFGVDNISKPVLELSTCHQQITLLTTEGGVEWYFNGNLIVSETGRKLSVYEEGLYSARLFNACNFIDSDVIFVKPLDISVKSIPNVITPNNDDLNEKFILADVFLGSNIKIFNRWGKLVYKNDSYNNEWDGRELPVGIYYYAISNPCLKEPFKGWVQVLR